MFKLLLYLSLNGVFSFNLETKNIWSFSNDNSTKFGYKVLFFPRNKPSVIISAPLDNGKDPEGAIFSCQANSNNTCKKLDVEKEDPDKSGAPELKKSQRSNQRMGFSMAIAGDFLYTCAPLWHETDTLKSSISYLGRCSLIDKNFNVIGTRSVCAKEFKDSSYSYKYCESGFSCVGSVTKDTEVFYLGAPGSLLSKGVLFASIESENNSTITLKSSDDRLKYYSYMGYSVAAGKFTDNLYGVVDFVKVNVVEDVVVDIIVIDLIGGAPRANELFGMFVLYSIKLDPSRIKLISIYESPDPQAGAYFGASLCAVDLNNDGKDDLLVGSPHYSIVSDEGRVYVYTNSKPFSGLNLQREYLDADRRPSAKFGSTISNVGDLNNDGYQDVAIGAPGGGPDGKGAVYIYNGGVTGIRPKYSQAIYASNFLSDFETGFGSSISNGQDVDGNEYPDIAIGAHDSGKVFLFRSQPVITLNDELKTNISQVPAELDSSNCLGPNGNKYHCIELKVELKFTGKNVPLNLDLEVTIEIDKQRNIGKRGFFKDNKMNQFKNILIQNVSLSKDNVSTIPTVVYITITGEIDIVEPIVFATKYKTFENSTNCAAGSCPVLDPFSTTDSNVQVTYLRKCADVDCKIDLSINSTITLPGSVQQNEIIYGAVNFVNIHSSIINFANTAYQASLKISFHTDLQIVGVDINGQSYPFWKLKTISAIKMELSFLVANSIKAMQSINVVVKFSVQKAASSSLKYLFELQTSAIGLDQDLSNNKVLLQIPVKVETCVRVQSNVFPMLVFYDKDFKPPLNYVTVTDIGPEVNFLFYIENTGFLYVDELVTEIDFVVQKEDNALIYVVDMKVDNVQCDPIVNGLNPKNISVYKFFSGGSEEKRHIRKKRDVSEDNLDCRSGTCKIYTCNITGLGVNQIAEVSVKARLWAASLAQLQLLSTNIWTSIDVRFNDRDHDRNVQRKDCNLSLNVKFAIQPTIRNTKKQIPWWIILLSVLGATLLLSFSITILHRGGFFERKRKIKNITSPNQQYEQKVTPDDADEADGEDN